MLAKKGNYTRIFTLKKLMEEITLKNEYYVQICSMVIMNNRRLKERFFLFVKVNLFVYKVFAREIKH